MRTKKPLITALDLEGTLVPEIWVSVAEKTSIKKLRLTTRDIPDYDALMKMRLAVLRDHELGLRDIQKIIRGMRPYSGAISFLRWLKKHSEVVILSDTFYEFAAPIMEMLGKPMLFCNSLEMNKKGIITNYHIRQKDGKRNAVRAFRKLGFRVIAIGDSFNDIGMLTETDAGAFLNAPHAIAKKFPSFPLLKNFRAARQFIEKNCA